MRKQNSWKPLDDAILNARKTLPSGSRLRLEFSGDQYRIDLSVVVEERAEDLTYVGKVSAEDWAEQLTGLVRAATR